MLRGYERHSAMGAAPSAGHADGAAGHHRLNVYLYIIVPKGFFPQQDTGRYDGSVAGGPGHFVSRDESESWSSSSRSCRKIRRSIHVSWIHRRRRRLAAVNTGRMFIQLKPLEERKRQRRSSHRPSASQAGAISPARRCSCKPRRICASAAAEQRAISVHAARRQA